MNFILWLFSCVYDVPLCNQRIKLNRLQSWLYCGYITKKTTTQKHFFLRLTGLWNAPAASSTTGLLLSLDEPAEALRCCWLERWEPREPLDPREL